MSILATTEDLQQEETRLRSNSGIAAKAPNSVEATGLRRNLLEGLALKILLTHYEMSLLELADAMHLSLSVVEELFSRLRKEQLCEVKGLAGRVYNLIITSKGRERALELLSTSQYSGPAPVSLTDYVKRVRAQSIMDVELRPENVEQALQHLVLSKQLIRQIGTALISAKTLLLYGPTGTGKTSIAESLPGAYQDSIWIPYAVEIDGQIITVYDSHVHQRIEESQSPEGDLRWIRCRRPRIIVDGELTLEALGLQFNPATKFYSAPLQMKANNGILIIDEFGRQRIRPEDLLNRWLVPLDRRVDYLSLATGNIFEVPFDLFVAFATNLDITTFASDAFLRRIPSKVRVDNVTPEQFHEIFRRVCESYELAYDAAEVDGFMGILGELKQPLRPCFPRDIIQQILWRARYAGTEPRIDRASIAHACRNYFLLSEAEAAPQTKPEPRLAA